MSRATAVTCDGCNTTVARPAKAASLLPPGWVSMTIWATDSRHGGKRVDICSPTCGARIIEVTVDPDTVPIEARLRAVRAVGSA